MFLWFSHSLPLQFFFSKLSNTFFDKVVNEEEERGGGWGVIWSTKKNYLTPPPIKKYLTIFFLILAHFILCRWIFTNYYTNVYLNFYYILMDIDYCIDPWFNRAISQPQSVQTWPKTKNYSTHWGCGLRCFQASVSWSNETTFVPARLCFIFCI